MVFSVLFLSYNKENKIYKNISPNHNVLSNSINNRDSNFIAKLILDRFSLICELDNSIMVEKIK